MILNLFINVVFGSNRTKNTLSAIELNNRHLVKTRLRLPMFVYEK